MNTALPVALCGLAPIAARRPEATRFGWVVSSHAAAFASHATCDVVAVFDGRRDLMADFRDTWIDFWPTLACYPLYELLLAEAKPTIVSISTPETSRAEAVLTALAAGVQGLLCEKPIATTPEDGDRIIAAVRAAGAHMVVNQPKRYDPLIHLARDTIRSGELGELRRLRCYHGGSRALLFRNGTHAIDTLCWLAGAPVVQVTGRLEPGFDDYEPYLSDRPRDPTREPTASARLTFANEVVAHYDGVRHGRRVLWFDIEGSRGGMRVHERHAELTTDGGTRVLVPEPYDRTGLSAAVSELVKLVQQGGESVSPPEAGRETLAVLQAILRSARERARPVAI
jgi:predicted dehydrogenase